jgi:hypothetical protein
MIKRTTLNFVLDSISFVNLLLLAATGALMRWVLPPPIMRQARDTVRKDSRHYGAT